MTTTKLSLTALLLCSGVAAAREAAPATGVASSLSRFVNAPPVVFGGSFISPNVELYGDVSIGNRSFIAGNTTVSAEPGTRVCIGNETNLQDNILFLAQRRLPFRAASGGCGVRATTTGSRTSVAHQAFVINSQLGSTPYVSLDLFIVPPRKMLQKAEMRR